MLRWFISLFKKKTLESVLTETRVVKIKGVAFRIRKVSALDYMAGFQVLREVFANYKVSAGTLSADPNLKKVKEIMGHTIAAGVVAPKISVKEEPGHILVDKLFVDMDIANFLYEEIVGFSYGKKKIGKLSSLGKGFLKLISYAKDTA